MYGPLEVSILISAKSYSGAAVVDVVGAGPVVVVGAALVVVDGATEVVVTPTDVVVVAPTVVVVGLVVTMMTAMSESSSSPVWVSMLMSVGLVRSMVGSVGLVSGVESVSSPSSAEISALLR